MNAGRRRSDVTAMSLVRIVGIMINVFYKFIRGKLTVACSYDKPNYRRKTLSSYVQTLERKLNRMALIMKDSLKLEISPEALLEELGGLEEEDESEDGSYQASNMNPKSMTSDKLME